MMSVRLTNLYFLIIQSLAFCTRRRLSCIFHISGREHLLVFKLISLSHDNRLKRILVLIIRSIIVTQSLFPYRIFFIVIDKYSRNMIISCFQYSTLKNVI
ncbi:hypothetical protein AAZX31_18G198000 [Glycine max]